MLDQRHRNIKKRPLVKVSMCSPDILHNPDAQSVHHRYRGLLLQVTLNDMPAASTRHTRNVGPALGQMMNQN